ncbi:NUMOD4 domain-containing protein [Chryseobacterium sp. SIMBA_029]|uniref:NUMOD4 domain-containing protein n=1 Tax=Chryseobacterium sp. SIMBA_029 TaxID=3085772 RepID=UPI00397AE2DA
MKLPPEFEDQYVKEVIYNRSLENLPDEKWELIEGFENYAISNYGRIKSLERDAPSLFGKERYHPEMILKLVFIKHFNKYLNRYFYNVNGRLSVDGKKTEKPISRLVYYHFVEKFDINDQRIYIETIDGNRLHLHSSNLNKISASEKSLKVFQKNRIKNRHVLYLQPVSQYTTEGKLVAHFDSFYAAEKAFGISVTAIYSAITNEVLITGGYRWFLQSKPPKKEDFISTDTSKRIFNEELWQRLGRPKINKSNPPACMNLSIEDIPGEQWKPLPDFEKQYSISNKGRVKRWEAWNVTGRRIFKKDCILPQHVEFKDDTVYSMHVILDNLADKKKKISIEIIRFLYYCFIKEFDLNSKTNIIINKNKPQWKADASKLILQKAKDPPKDKKLKSIRIIANSGNLFNSFLWEKLAKPKIDKKNPPAILNLSLKDLPDEQWKPLPGYEDKYVISNKGRIKRLSGWRIGIIFFEEEQIVITNLTKVKDSCYLVFRLHEQVRTSLMALPRFLYYCFVNEFDLNDMNIVIVNENTPLWNMELSKFSLKSSYSVLKGIK